ncbi:MAG: hypothetical protein NT075_11705 [Chloroflexi bacterium]|nr:hypothetical protein [Chloroflexota bacterium]
MSTLATSFLTLLGLVLSFLVLAWLSWQISRHLRILVAYITGSIDFSTVIFFLILLPGIIIHEAAHWITAYVLGLKPSQFRVWPKPQGRFIGLGSVKVRRGNLWQDNLVGLAPLIVGSSLLALIGQRIFFANQVADAILQGHWTEAFRDFWQAISTADGALWAYLLFVIGNAMMPSVSDRESLKPLLIYVTLAALLYVLLGLPLSPLTAALARLNPTVEDLTGAFIFTSLLDGAVLLAIYLLEVLVGLRKGAKLRS